MCSTVVAQQACPTQEAAPNVRGQVFASENGTQDQQRITCETNFQINNTQCLNSADMNTACKARQYDFNCAYNYFTAAYPIAQGFETCLFSGGGSSSLCDAQYSPQISNLVNTYCACLNSFNCSTSTSTTTSSSIRPSATPAVKRFCGQLAVIAAGCRAGRSQAIYDALCHPATEMTLTAIGIILIEQDPELAAQVEEIGVVLAEICLSPRGSVVPTPGFCQALQDVYTRICNT